MSVLQIIVWVVLIILVLVLAVLLCVSQLKSYKGGSETTIVFINGLGDPPEVWNSVCDGLPDETTFTSDWPGFGKNSGDLLPKTPRDTADLLHMRLEKTNARRPFVLVGHSGGALIALVFQDRFPNDVKGVVLVDPTPKFVIDTPPAVWPADIPLTERHFMQMFSEFREQIPYDQLQKRDITAIIDVRDDKPRDKIKLEEARKLYPKIVETHNATHWIHKTNPGVVVDAIRKYL